MTITKHITLPFANSVRYLMPQEMKLNMSGRQDLHEQLIFLIREDQNV